jgi:hypothetical protein
LDGDCLVADPVADRIARSATKILKSHRVVMALNAASRSCRKLLVSVNSRLKQGEPRGNILRELMEVDCDSLDLETIKAHATVRDMLMKTMADRNVAGMALEKNEKNKEAIRLYEQNVSDHCDGSHPYERLRILYTRCGDYPNAIRVCQIYLDTIPQKNWSKSSPSQRHIDELQAQLRGEVRRESK